MKQKILFILLFLTLNYFVRAQDLPDNIVEACSVLPPAMAWSIDYSKSTDMIYSPYQNALVGDIDDDGIVEIIVCANPLTPSPVADRNSNQIAIFKGNDISAPYMTITTQQPYSWDAYTKYAIVRTTIDSKEKVIIVVVERDLYMRAYDPNSATPNTPIWTSSEVYHSSSVNTPTVTFADLNRDGVPEILIAGKVFNSTNGQLLCKISTESAGGISTLSVPIAEDVFQDGTTRLILGNKIYKPDAALSTLTLERTITPAPHASDPDNPGTLSITNSGRTSVVDMDLDGNLDLVISTNVSGYTYIYVADPETGDVKASKVIVGATSSYPFVGDIDGDGYPEIVFIKATSTTTGLSMFAYKYVSGNPVLQQFWELGHSDTSGLTAMTLFDFNQDGVSEIVYRDETHIRIIDGSLKNAATPYNLAEYQCSSGTSTEYPTIADIDNDGQAEIIIVGGNDRTIDPYHIGHLWVFKSGDPFNYPWAPARSVWNQYAYNSLNVNKDLTIPKNPISPATVFAGEDKVLNTSDDVRPFNNFLQQQTTLDQYGVPLWLAPNAQIAGTPVFSYDESTDQMTVIVVVKNTGDAIFQAPFYVTVYKDIAGGSPNYTYTYANTIDIDETVTMTFVIPDFQADGWVTYNFIILKINDNGDGTNNQEVCDDSQNQYRYYGLLPTQQDVCQGKVKEMTCSFILSATDTYQWQSSKDNLTWTDITGATAVSYTPANQARGTLYYRVVVTNGTDTETVNSESAHVRVRSCRLPVNHNISAMGYHD